MRQSIPDTEESDGYRAEAAGDWEGAIRGYVAGKQLEEAARILFSMQRFAEAARVLLSGVGPQPSADPLSMSRAKSAAACLQRLGDTVGSSALYRVLGDVKQPWDPAATKRAIDTHAQAGNIELAARLARLTRAPSLAAAYFSRARMPFEAGVSHYDGGDLRAALAAFQSVPQSSPVYRNACLNAIHIAAQLDAVSFELDAFLASFVHGEPRDLAELAAFYTLAVLYQKVGYDADARDLLNHLNRIDPTYRDVAQRLAQLDSNDRVDDLTSLLGDDVGFWGRKAGSSPAKNEIPSVPSLTPGRGPRLESSSPPRRQQSIRPPDVPRRKQSGEMVAVSALEVAPGDLVANRYRIEEEIGRGGMSAVFRALDSELSMHVALKVFQEAMPEANMMARFKQELMICRQLSHPNIIRLHDIGTDLGRKFISMELLSGCLLGQSEGLADLHKVIHYLQQVAQGLSVVHQAGVVHRDIKPNNLFVTSNDVVKIMDFGIAKRHEVFMQSLTGTGFVAGTPGYMAPEQYTDFSRVAATADIYSLGVVAYEIVTGQRLFDEPTVEVLYKQMTSVPPPPSSKVEGVPPALDELIMRMLARDPGARPQTCEEVSATLAEMR